MQRSTTSFGARRIGRYTVEERQARIRRYQEKKMARNFKKKIKYVCRKTLADSRPRVHGRFAKHVPAPAADEAKPGADAPGGMDTGKG